MRNIQPHSCRLVPKTPTDEYLSTLKSQMPQLDALFTKLAAGATPNFLDIIAAISEMVAFHVDCDQIGEACEALEKEMSQKKCLFCY